MDDDLDAQPEQPAAGALTGATSAGAPLLSSPATFRRAGAPVPGTWSRPGAEVGDGGTPSLCVDAGASCQPGGDGCTPDFTDLTDEDMTVLFDRSVAAVRAAQWYQLAVAAEIDRREMWRADGMPGVRAWLAMRTGEGQRSTYHDAEVGAALDLMPGLSSGLADGALSKEAVRCLLILGELTGAGDDELVSTGLRHTVPQLETACRAARWLEREPADADANRSFRWWCDDNGVFHIRGRLTALDGLTVTGLLSAMAMEAGPDPATGLYDPFDARCADALVRLCSGGSTVSDTNAGGSRLETDLHRSPGDATVGSPPAAEPAHRPDRAPDDRSNARRHPDDTDGGGDACPSGDPEAVAGERTRVAVGGAPTVVIHVPLAALVGSRQAGAATTFDGVVIAGDTLRRICCDSRLRIAVEDETGRTVGIGRRSRMIPKWLGDQLRWRDRSCRFPGCETTRFVHAHHVRHWADGGPTDLGNLLQLCGRHHRLVHEGRWSVDGDPDGRMTFTSPSGASFPSHPGVHLPALRRRRARLGPGQSHAPPADPD